LTKFEGDDADKEEEEVEGGEPPDERDIAEEDDGDEEEGEGEEKDAEEIVMPEDPVLPVMVDVEWAVVRCSSLDRGAVVKEGGIKKKKKRDDER